MTITTPSVSMPIEEMWDPSVVSGSGLRDNYGLSPFPVASPLPNPTAVNIAEIRRPLISGTPSIAGLLTNQEWQQLYMALPIGTASISELIDRIRGDIEAIAIHTDMPAETAHAEEDEAVFQLAPAPIAFRVRARLRVIEDPTPFEWPNDIEE